MNGVSYCNRKSGVISVATSTSACSFANGRTGDGVRLMVGWGGRATRIAVANLPECSPVALSALFWRDCLYAMTAIAIDTIVSKLGGPS